jgi:hypothetical protein
MERFNAFMRRQMALYYLEIRRSIRLRRARRIFGGWQKEADATVDQGEIAGLAFGK